MEAEMEAEDVSENLGEIDMKKMSLQIVVTLVLGCGALLMSAPQAQAGQGCPSQCVNVIPTPCTVQPGGPINDAVWGKGTRTCTAKITTKSPTVTVSSCLDCGSCTKQNVDVTTKTEWCYSVCEDKFKNTLYS
jgi:hypothetical protein